MESQYLSSLPTTRNYLQTRRDKLSQEFNRLIIERDRSLKEIIFKSLCLLDNEVSKNISPISSYGLKAMTEISEYIKSKGIIFQ